MNNRIIKFRAWDKKNKEMFYYPKWAFIHDGNVLYFAQNNDSYVDESDNRTDLDLMQFTGLYDKNGKGIYEGDIVKWGVGSYPISFGWGDDNESYGESYGWLLGSSIISQSSSASALQFNNEAEVIGNIYENPELLKS
jgi:uncharacterized phage protein (TIGR01671 family)